MPHKKWLKKLSVLRLEKTGLEVWGTYKNNF